MNINNYYYAGVYADHRGYNVLLARINNVDDPGIIYLVSSVSSPLPSNQTIAQHIDEAIETIDQPNDYLKTEKLVVVLINENRSLQWALFSNLKKEKPIHTYSSKDVKQSLYCLSEKLRSGKFIVKASLTRDIEIDLAKTTDTDISHQIESLMIISDNYCRFRSLSRSHDFNRWRY